MKNGDWLRAAGRILEESGCCEVPVPLFQRAARSNKALGPPLFAAVPGSGLNDSIAATRGIKRIVHPFPRGRSCWFTAGASQKGPAPATRHKSEIPNPKSQIPNPKKPWPWPCMADADCYIYQIRWDGGWLASVAQRQSSGFVNRRLWVRIPPLAPRDTVDADASHVPPC